MTSIESLLPILSHPTWDVLVILFFIAASFFYGLYGGRERLISTLLGLYVTQLLFANFRFTAFLTDGRGLMEVFLLKLALFLAVLVLLTHLFNRSLFAGFVRGDRAWGAIFLLSAFDVGLFMAIVIRLLPAADLFTFSPVVQHLFASKDVFFWWLVLPLIALFYIMRRH